MAKYATGDASGGSLVKSQHFDPPEDAPAYLIDAVHDIGIHEWVQNGKDRRSNPIVEEWIKITTGERNNAMTTPWCQYYINAKLEKAGVKSTKDGMARSSLKWGEVVDMHDDSQWRVGDIGVKMRGSYDDHSLGHVFFIVAWDEETVTGLGGNQHDMVCLEQFQRSQLLGVRRPRGLWKSHTIRSTVAAAADEAVVKPIAQYALPEPDKLTDAVDQVRGPLETLSHSKPWIIGILSAISIALIVYAAYCRYADQRSGKNA